MCSHVHAHTCMCVCMCTCVLVCVCVWYLSICILHQFRCLKKPDEGIRFPEAEVISVSVWATGPGNQTQILTTGQSLSICASYSWKMNKSTWMYFFLVIKNVIARRLNSSSVVGLRLLLPKTRFLWRTRRHEVDRSSIRARKHAKEGGKEGGELTPKSPRQGQGTGTMNGGFIAGLS